MRKSFFIDLVLLFLVLSVAVYAYFGMPQGAVTPVLGDLSTTPSTQETTEETVTVPTDEGETEQTTAPEQRELTAQKAFVYDVQEQMYLYRMGQEQEMLYPASITKLFTAYVALQYLDPEQNITVGAALTMLGEDSSLAQLEEGEVLTTKMLLAAMLLPSGNDAAYVLAAEAGRAIADDQSYYDYTAVGVFVEEMNRQAKALGMTGTHFTNPDGYHDAGHYSTGADMMTLAQLCLDNELIMRYAGMAEVQTELVSGEAAHWTNTNALIHPDSAYYCPYVTGLKTGQTEAAGSCLLVSLEIADRQYVIGVFGSAGHEERFADTLQLIHEVFPDLSDDTRR